MRGTRSPVDAKRAQREAIDRALAAPLNATDLRVLLALLRLMSLWDRLEDRVSNTQLREVTGITDERRVRKATARLAALGIIEREAGGGRKPDGTRIATLYRLPSTPGVTDQGCARTGVPETQDPGSLSAVTPGPHAPASEVLSEASSEVPFNGYGDHIAQLRAEIPLLARGTA